MYTYLRILKTLTVRLRMVSVFKANMIEGHLFDRLGFLYVFLILLLSS